MSAGAISIPTGDISGMNGGLDLGADLASGYDSAISGGESEAPGGADETPSWGDSELFKADQPETNIQAPPVEQAEQPQPGASPADSPYQLSPDGKFYQVPKSDLPNFQNAQKYHQAVSQYFATPQEAQQAQEQAASLRIMSRDFASGQDQYIQQVLNHWAGNDHAANPQMQQRYQQSFAKMAELMPGTLKQLNPQAYDGMAGRFISDRIEAAYQKAALSGTPEDFRAAQEMDYGFTQQYKTDLSQIQKPQTQQVTQQEQRMKEFETREANALKRDIGDFNNTSVEGAKFKMLGDSIDKTLAKIKDRYSEVAYNDLKAGIHRELIDTMKAKQDSWWTEHTQEWQSLMDGFRAEWKAGRDGSALKALTESYKQSFVTRANQLLPAIAQKRIGAATQAAQARSRTGQFAAPQPQTRQPAQAAAPQPPAGKMSSDQFDKEWAAEFAQFRQ